jgi:hypothetical protein
LAGLRDDYPVPRQLQFFTRSQVAEMRDRTASRSYSPEGEAFRREHERHRAWGLDRRHAEKLRRGRASSRASQQAHRAGDRPQAQTLPSREREAHPAPSRRVPSAQGMSSHTDGPSGPGKPARASRVVAQESRNGSAQAGRPRPSSINPRTSLRTHQPPPAPAPTARPGTGPAQASHRILDRPASQQPPPGPGPGESPAGPATAIKTGPDESAAATAATTRISPMEPPIDPGAATRTGPSKSAAGTTAATRAGLRESPIGPVTANQTGPSGRRETLVRAGSRASGSGRGPPCL